MDDGCEIFGAEEVERALHEMGAKLAKQALGDALDYAGSVLQTALSEVAPVYEGTAKGSPHPATQLQQDIRRKVRVDLSTGEGRVVVGPSKHSFFGSFREFGTSHEPAQPWLRPAFDSHAQEALDIFCKVLAAHIADAAKGKS